MLNMRRVVAVMVQFALDFFSMRRGIDRFCEWTNRSAPRRFTAGE
jgi:hypothetical protein